MRMSLFIKIRSKMNNQNLLISIKNLIHLRQLTLSTFIPHKISYSNPQQILTAKKDEEESSNQKFQLYKRRYLNKKWIVEEKPETKNRRII